MCVGGIREVLTPSRRVTTGIFKQRVDGPVAVSGVNLHGDDQADRTVHGGPDKAVYGFPGEHYTSWRAAFPGLDFTESAFGEYLTTEGLLEDDLCIGDQFRCGTCKLRLTQPRMPCFKLAIRLGDKSVIRHMLDTRQTGFYFTIVREGTLRAGDDLVPIGRPNGAIPMSVITRVMASKTSNPDDLRAIAGGPFMVEQLRVWAAEQIARPDPGP